MGPEIGTAGRAVVANVERLRQDQGMSLRDLSVRLGQFGRPTLPSVLHRLINGGRRVDADDLVAFAKALGVSPADLLQPDLSVEIRVGRGKNARTLAVGTPTPAGNTLRGPA